MTTRFVDEDAAIKAAGKGAGAFQRWIARQPRAPQLVRRKEAAKILGVQSPHITRFIKQERMPEAVEIGGGLNVYLRDEVEAFAKELEAEREQAEARAEERRLEQMEREARAQREREEEAKRERKRAADRRYRERKRAEAQKEKDG